VNASSRPRSVEVRAQAKINLRLRILARETSGYHQLETLFHRIELADVIRIRRTKGERTLDIAADADREAIGPTERNLAWRAADSYFAATGISGGFAIELEKRIPIGGGLGGGSADAGAVLRALDAMADVPLGEQRLLQLAAALGADVPFLASEHAYALAWGRGERMIAIQPPPARDVLLLMPEFAVSTVDAFGWLAVRRAQQGTPHDVEGLVLHPPQLERWDNLRQFAINDFETVVAERHPVIGLLLAAHRASPSVELAMLSGSGSTVFAIVRDGATHVLAKPEALGGARSMMTRTTMRVEPPSPIE
jgi:4-diphosphocytidyl-2-C-methyl-D-erythritol kinase